MKLATPRWLRAWDHEVLLRCPEIWDSWIHRLLPAVLAVHAALWLAPLLLPPLCLDIPDAEDQRELTTVVAILAIILWLAVTARAPEQHPYRRHAGGLGRTVCLFAGAAALCLLPISVAESVAWRIRTDFPLAGFLDQEFRRNFADAHLVFVELDGPSTAAQVASKAAGTLQVLRDYRDHEWQILIGLFPELAPIDRMPLGGMIHQRYRSDIRDEDWLTTTCPERAQIARRIFLSIYGKDLEVGCEASLEPDRLPPVPAIPAPEISLWGNIQIHRAHDAAERAENWRLTGLLLTLTSLAVLIPALAPALRTAGLFRLALFATAVLVATALAAAFLPGNLADEVIWLPFGLWLATFAWAMALQPRQWTRFGSLLFGFAVAATPLAPLFLLALSDLELEGFWNVAGYAVALGLTPIFQWKINRWRAIPE